MIKRTNQLLFRVSDDELQQIEEKMNSLGFRNREAYIRKMVLDGYCIRLDLKDLRELTKQMHAVGNNLNQYARWANEAYRDCHEKNLPSLPNSADKIQ